MAGQDDDRLSGNTLKVPYIFVPSGQTVPPDWLAAHPDAIRVSARMVSRQGSRTIMARDEAAGAAAQAPGGAASPARRSSDPPAQAARAAASSSSPSVPPTANARNAPLSPADAATAYWQGLKAP